MKSNFGNQKKTVWIFGAGRFGLRSFKILSKKYPADSILVVDKNPDTFSHFESEAVTLVCADAADYLVKNLVRGCDEPRWIVPAVSVHLAFRWLKARLEGELHFQQLPVPDPVISLLPNPVSGSHGQVYISYADFICPPHCPEPETFCTFTGKPRSGILYQYLSRLEYENFRSVVLRSCQLAPGVGGYSPSALFETLEVRNSPGPVLFSTACACHGLMHAFTISKIKQ